MTDINQKYKYAYLVVIPNPEEGVLGIQCRVKNSTQLPSDPNMPSTSAKYLFWLKIGDTSQEEPWSRLKDAAIIEFSDPETVEKGHLGGGKQLENKVLSDYEQGGMGETNRSEWRALYADSEDGARDLCKRLKCLLDHYNPPGLKKDFTRKKSFQEVIETLNKAKQNTPPVKHGAPSDLDFITPMVTIIIVPSVHHHDERNRGYVRETLQGKMRRFWVHLSGTMSNHATPYHLVSSYWISETPDFAYNSFRTKKDKTSQSQAMKDTQDDLNTVLKDLLSDRQNFQLFSPEYESKTAKGWYYIDVKDPGTDKKALEQYVSFV
ncbi:unnamed protein product [Rhizoctonia solani]|uniref:Uncharacterized protein n=1 Tax=Rhizoctonia solani TaxID=456999 RepID=A0A8H3BIX9_9AGAM|nr:unnamed protein product [Rhizoctonia solani]